MNKTALTAHWVEVNGCAQSGGMRAGFELNF